MGRISTVDCLFKAHPLPLEHILSLLAISYHVFSLFIVKNLQRKLHLNQVS